MTPTENMTHLTFNSICKDFSASPIVSREPQGDGNRFSVFLINVRPKSDVTEHHYVNSSRSYGVVDDGRGEGDIVTKLMTCYAETDNKAQHVRSQPPISFHTSYRISPNYIWFGFYEFSMCILSMPL